ncbi:hypothetical protein STEG23_003757 [Scotinomys teguina]
MKEAENGLFPPTVEDADALDLATLSDPDDLSYAQSLEFAKVCKPVGSPVDSCLVDIAVITDGNQGLEAMEEAPRSQNQPDELFAAPGKKGKPR